MPSKQNRPKRPMSAYNFFFREERQKILDAGGLHDNEKVPKNDESNNEKRASPSNGDEDNNNEEQHSNKRQKTEQATTFAFKPGGTSGLDANKKKKGRKQPHGKISFTELGRIIGQRWKQVTEEDSNRYKALAVEDMNRYRREMQVYHEEQALEMRRRGREDIGQTGNESSALTTNNNSLASSTSGQVHSSVQISSSTMGDSLPSTQTSASLTQSVALSPGVQGAHLLAPSQIYFPLQVMVPTTPLNEACLSAASTVLPVHGFVPGVPLQVPSAEQAGSSVSRNEGSVSFPNVIMLPSGLVPAQPLVVLARPLEGLGANISSAAAATVPKQVDDSAKN